MDTILKLGSKGEDVKKLQEKLKINPDGVFGLETESAVKKWQSSNGLKKDGIVGEQTWSKLFGSKELITEPFLSSEVSIQGFLEKLKGHIPNEVINQIPEMSKKFDISTPLRLAHFLSQCSHESAGFKSVQENLNYSVNGLKKTFPKYFPGNLSESYARNPEKIASKVYGNRMGNGDETTKEGFKFRGRGYIQLTGKDNYISFGQAINEDLVSNPDKVATQYPLLSAAWFFHKNKLNKIADEGNTREIVEKITRRINGGLNGIEHRVSEFSHYYRLLSE